MPPLRRAVLDGRIDVRVLARHPLVYDAGPDSSEDRPAHVRSASGAVFFGGRLAIIQDDALFVALVDGEGRVSSVSLPPGHGGRRLFDDARGNKRHKLDLEACLVLGSSLVVFGSGSTPERERVVLVHDDGSVRVVDASALYAKLRARRDFTGSELNIEGALAHGERVILASRGNGAPNQHGMPVDATCCLYTAALQAFLEDPTRHPPPAVTDVEQFDLGHIDGARLTFTDLALDPRDGARVLYVACAEASPDATRDGPVSGVAVGVLGETPRYGLVRDERGLLLTDKIEGLVARQDGTLLGVIDVDEPLRAAEILELSFER